MTKLKFYQQLGDGILKKGVLLVFFCFLVKGMRTLELTSFAPCCSSHLVKFLYNWALPQAENKIAYLPLKVSVKRNFHVNEMLKLPYCLAHADTR